ncbi:hypothetical protein QJS10_CPB15g01202 [Acorus calamus]|uniref:Uncharacterized protein n=1 Tax=Acorus calamus TaxID=4465 RepID=A0AAV9D491_ACOCL|nr:hypothetical protein QJS10_CPB15g01202 [Acorus calamus]
MNYLAPGISDHSSLKVTLDHIIPTGPRPFKYFEMWETHPSFKDTVEATWGLEVRGSPMYRLVQKLSATKSALKQWNKECFGPVQNLLHRSKQELADIQSILHNSPNDETLMSLERSSRDSYPQHLSQEETFLRQKSRQMWLSSGDSNSKFFYDSIKSRSAINTISRLRSPDGSMLTAPEEIKEHIVHFYSELLNRDSGSCIPQIQAYGTLSEVDNLRLLSPVVAEEIRKAVFSLKPLSSPGPDGFPARFFQLFWPTVQYDLVEAIQSFFYSGNILRQIRKKLASWTVHSLSRAGRLELIKSVVSSFHIFWSSAVRIPRRTQKDIEKMLRDFLWQGNSPDRKAHHVNWDIICKPLEEGGLGIKAIKDWTNGAVGVRLWDIAQNKLSL